MALHPTFPAPERILAFGGPGVGKTTNLLNMALFAHTTKSPARFFVLDSDFAMDRMIRGYPQIPYGIYGDPNFPITPESRLIIYPVFLWTEYVKALADIQRQATPNDWVSVDFISNAWAAVQEHYVNEVFHKDIGEYFLQVRRDLDKDAKSLGALEGWVDWQVINPMYKKWANQLLYRGRYHIYCTAKMENLSSDKKPTEDPQTRAMFSRIQVKPVGQKDLSHQFHTVLYCSRSGENRTISAMKDRELDEVNGLVVHNFTTDYLVKVAGWSLV